MIPLRNFSKILPRSHSAPIFLEKFAIWTASRTSIVENDERNFMAAACLWLYAIRSLDVCYLQIDIMSSRLAPIFDSVCWEVKKFASGRAFLRCSSMSIERQDCGTPYRLGRWLLFFGLFAGSASYFLSALYFSWVTSSWCYFICSIFESNYFPPSVFKVCFAIGQG